MKKENENLPEIQGEKKNGIAVKNDVMFATFDIANANQSHIDAVINAPSLNFDVKASYWSPEKGEVKRLIYQGIKEKVKTKNSYGEAEYVYIDTAYFVELSKSGHRMLSNASSVLVNYFQTNNTPVHAVLDITYKGKSKSKSGNMFDDFSISPVPVSFD